jgi:hypothetical protein
MRGCAALRMNTTMGDDLTEQQSLNDDEPDDEIDEDLAPVEAATAFTRNFILRYENIQEMPPGAERDSEVRLATLELAMAEFFANVAGADR